MTVFSSVSSELDSASAALLTAAPAPFSDSDTAGLFSAGLLSAELLSGVLLVGVVEVELLSGRAALLAALDEGLSVETVLLTVLGVLAMLDAGLLSASSELSTPSSELSADPSGRLSGSDSSSSASEESDNSTLLSLIKVLLSSDDELSAALHPLKLNINSAASNTKIFFIPSRPCRIIVMP